MTPAADLLPRGDREFAQLVAAVGPEHTSSLAAQTAGGTHGSCDWPRVAGLAHRHRLAPLLYAALQRPGAVHVPAPVLAELRAHGTRSHAVSAMLWGELLRVVNRLREAGIAAIAYKGPAAALVAYGDIGLRQFSDLDIMVRRADVWRAATVLMNAGFEADLHVAEPLRDNFTRDEYVLMFRGGDGRTLLELHWAVARRTFGTPVDEQALWSRVRTISHQGGDVLVPSDEDQLVLACVHASRHGWDKLEAVVNVAAIARRPGLDWEYMASLAGRMQARRMVQSGLDLASGLLGVPSPVTLDVVPRSTLRTIVSRMTEDEAPGPGWRRLALQLRLKDSAYARLEQCGRQLLTPTGGDRSAVRLPRMLSFAYPLVRAVRLVRKYGLSH